MYLSLKSILVHNVVLKVISSIIGITFWLIISQSHSTTLQCSVPLCFYGTSDTYTIKSPEMLSITLQGKRGDLTNIDLTQLALHINVQDLNLGPNRILVSPATLFLPKSINVLNYTPLNSVITIEKVPQKNGVSLSHPHT